MNFRFPEDDRQFTWTRHIKNKMLFYGLSEQRVRGVFKSPARLVEGVAEDTIAAMKPNSTKSRREEVWIMYRAQKVKSKQAPKILMISAWRYPGLSNPEKAVPIPEEVVLELGLRIQA